MINTTSMIASGIITYLTNSIDTKKSTVGYSSNTKSKHLCFVTLFSYHIPPITA